MSHNNIPDIGDALTNLPDGKKTINPQPKDPSKWHFRISIVKSGMRFAAAFRLIQGDMVGAGVFFIIAEALGIAEEMF